MLLQSRFWLVDVFAERDEPFTANPLAVVMPTSDAEPAVDDMQRCAAWLNYSETVFLLRPSDARADYRVRIFTTTGELPFAGHPTLGACSVWLNVHAGVVTKNILQQQCGAGLIRIQRRANGMLAFAAPPLVRSGPVETARRAALLADLRLAPALVTDVQYCQNGPAWVAVMCTSSQAVLDCDPASVPGDVVRVEILVVHFFSLIAFVRASWVHIRPARHTTMKCAPCGLPQSAAVAIRRRPRPGRSTPPLRSGS